jgi:iron complex transport system substrate-binding protein
METFSVYGNIKAPAERIISLAPSITEMLFYLGMADSVVGVTRQCNYPPAVKEKETVGSFLVPDLERIAALEPDTIIGLANLHKHLPETVQTERSAVILLDYYRVREVLDVMEAAASLAEDKVKALELVASLRGRVDALDSGEPERWPVRTLFLISASPIMTPSRHSFQYDALKITGAKQITLGYTQYECVTPEEVAHFNPEIILSCGVHRGEPLTEMCPDCKSKEPVCRRIVEDLALRAPWRETEAAKQGNIMALPCHWLCRPGPRLINGIEEITRILRDYREARG